MTAPGSYASDFHGSVEHTPLEAERHMASLLAAQRPPTYANGGHRAAELSAEMLARDAWAQKRRGYRWQGIGTTEP